MRFFPTIQKHPKKVTSSLTAAIMLLSMIDCELLWAGDDVIHVSWKSLWNVICVCYINRSNNEQPALGNTTTFQWNRSQNHDLLIFKYRMSSAWIHSIAKLLMCVRSLSCCITQLLFSFRLQTNALTLCCWIFWDSLGFTGPSVTASCPDPEAAKQP